MKKMKHGTKDRQYNVYGDFAAVPNYHHRFLPNDFLMSDIDSIEYGIHNGKLVVFAILEQKLILKKKYDNPSKAVRKIIETSLKKNKEEKDPDYSIKLTKNQFEYLKEKYGNASNAAKLIIKRQIDIENKCAYCQSVIDVQAVTFNLCPDCIGGLK